MNLNLSVRSEAKVAQACPALCDPIDYTVHGILQARILKWVVFPLSRRSSQPMDGTPRSPTLQSDSLPAEPQGKPKNTGVGSRSLLQRIFPTQGSNPGLLHCRQIIYQLSYEGSLKAGERRGVAVCSPSHRLKWFVGGSLHSWHLHHIKAISWKHLPFRSIYPLLLIILQNRNLESASEPSCLHMVGLVPREAPCAEMLNLND